MRQNETNLGLYLYHGIIEKRLFHMQFKPRLKILPLVGSIKQYIKTING